LGGDAKTPLPIAATELTAIFNETKTGDGKAVPAMTNTLKPTDAAMARKTVATVLRIVGTGTLAHTVVFKTAALASRCEACRAGLRPPRITAR